MRNGSVVQNVCSIVLFLILWFICVMFARIACLFGIYSYIIGVFWQRVALGVVKSGVGLFGLSEVPRDR